MRRAKRQQDQSWATTVVTLVAGRATPAALRALCFDSPLFLLQYRKLEVRQCGWKRGCCGEAHRGVRPIVGSVRNACGVPQRRGGGGGGGAWGGESVGVVGPTPGGDSPLLLHQPHLHHSHTHLAVSRQVSSLVQCTSVVLLWRKRF
ncbi:hypothetical protein E2C01_079850 [Portunus trituberculatus]|uniref:Uncharacterized protein n=1 Tax=Portunus trituberculatus TaxID=210409 RepID=A0A5B7IMK0_PORTR|nr:hypothetical protein [Portunus trituberculatus]